VAQKVVVSLVDDLDGSKADETVAFALDGKTYEIDLNRVNASKLRDTVAPYATAARKSAGRRRTAPGTPAGGREQNQAIREWARARQMKVADRGRLPVEVIAAYQRRT